MNGFNPTYDDNKIENMLYLGKVITDKTNKQYRRAEIIINAGELPLEKTKETDDCIKAKIINDVVLYKTLGGQQKIHCWIEKYPNGYPFITGLRLSRRTKKGSFAKQEICLNPEAVARLKKFLDNIFCVDFSNSSPQKIDFDNYAPTPDFKTVKISQKDFENILSYNIEHINNYESILELKRREEAIKRLEEIIENEDSYKNEVDINKFLLNHLWMFNNEYVFFSEDNKINAQNILDLVPVTFDGYVDIVELKLPTVKILNYDSSHKNYYPSSELTKAIGQCMNYIIEMEKLLIDKPNFYKPKATIIIGSKNELTKQEQDFLRLLNSSYHNIKIYTYQQLLARAKNSLNFIKKKKDM